VDANPKPCALKTKSQKNSRNKPLNQNQRSKSQDQTLEINLLLTLDLREQAALQSALVTHGAPDALVTLALTGACRISSVAEARHLREWLAAARSAGETDFASLQVIERALITFGL
jgi:hypothetical protein